MNSIRTTDLANAAALASSSWEVELDFASNFEVSDLVGTDELIASRPIGTGKLIRGLNNSMSKE